MTKFIMDNMFSHLYVLSVLSSTVLVGRKIMHDMKKSLDTFKGI